MASLFYRVRVNYPIIVHKGSFQPKYYLDFCIKNLGTIP